MNAEQIASLRPALAALLGRFRDCFRRTKTLGYLEKYILGLMTDLPRKSVEPIALAAGVPVRTLQEFLADFRWDHERAEAVLHRRVTDRHAHGHALGILDASGHPKQGDKTPGVHHQYCGESGKQDNCVVGQHLLYTDNDPANPFSCMLCSDLYLPRAWTDDRDRCREAGIPDTLAFRTKWQIAVEQIARAIGHGVRFSYLVFDSDYGRVPKFWFALDRLGQRGVGDVPSDFPCWATPPACHSGRAEHGSKRVDHLAVYSPAFTRQPWRAVTVKHTTHGRQRWRLKATRVQLVVAKDPQHRGHSTPTDRRYWLIVADNLQTGERKYLVSNAAADADPADLLRIGQSRWHVEKWFERAKEEAGLGAFEVRRYTGLKRHWLASALAMYFLASQTQRLRGEKSTHHVRTSGHRGQCDRLGSLAAMAHPMVVGDPTGQVSSVA
jgi:SRSO17 transposase